MVSLLRVNNDSGGGGGLQSISGDLVDNSDPLNPVVSIGYAKYVCTLVQDATDAPVPTVLENTIGNIVWSRVSAGFYRATLAGAFPLDKTAVFITPNTGDLQLDEIAVTVARAENPQSPNRVTILTADFGGNLADSILKGYTIEIRVYP